jgi:hypothetical protein
MFNKIERGVEMNDLTRDLYYLMEARFGEEHYYQPEYQAISQQFHQYLDQVDDALGRGFYDGLYDTVMDYLSLEQRCAFLWGLRLGLQLQGL